MSIGWWEARTRQWTGISTWDGNRSISLLARRSRDVFLWFRFQGGLKAILLHRGSSMLNTDWWRLESERFGLGKGRLAFLGILSPVVLPVLGFVDRVVIAMEVGREGWGHGSLLEAGGVGCGLRAELGEVEI